MKEKVKNVLREAVQAVGAINLFEEPLMSTQAHHTRAGKVKTLVFVPSLICVFIDF